MKLNDLVDDEMLAEMLATGYVKRQVHPVLPLAVLNYSQKAMFDHVWNPVTRQCRGLIYDTCTLAVIARPFPKFFNLGELQDHEVPAGPFRVLDKVDGSLGILYPAGDSWAVATRGSFISEQAVHATDRLSHYLALGWRPLPDCTYLWEIVFPENRIVVDYGAMDDLVLLEVLRTEDHRRLGDPLWPGPRVGEYPNLRTIEAVSAALDRPNTEGYVLRFDSGERVKVKAEEYVRLHRILTGISAKTIWEHLVAGSSLDPMLDLVPDEFFRWVQETAAGLRQAYELREALCVRDLPAMVVEGDEDTENPRRGFARAVVAHPYRSVLFCMLDSRPYAHLIWKGLKPAAEKPFREDEP